MVEVERWIDNLCADADRSGIQPANMIFLLSQKINQYSLKIRTQQILNEKLPGL